MRQFRRRNDRSFVDLATGYTIPDDPANRERRRIDALVAAGAAEILPPDPVPVPSAKERRRAEYAARLPVYDVIEALLEAETGNRVKLDAALAEYAAIRLRHPGA